MTRLTYSLVFVLAACGGSSSTPEKPVVPVPAAWKDKNHEQKEQYMKDVVMPKAKELFVAFDAKTYANMDCKTCHGDGADDGSFEMPDAKIPMLPNSEEAFMKWIGEKPERGPMAQFMSEKLEPEMAALLGMTPFNPADGTGDFGCTACHNLMDPSGQPVPAEPHH